MTYSEIFILGWNLNALMFALNLIIALRAIKTSSKEQLVKENQVLNELKIELERYYPYRKYTTLLSYMVPFTAFFRVTYRMIEMRAFLNRNVGTSIYDYMQYKYQSEIDRAKNR